MFALIQMQTFDVVRSACAVNVEYEGTPEEPLRSFLTVRDQVQLDPPEDEVAISDVACPLLIDVQTEFVQIDHETEHEEFFRILLFVRVNHFDEEVLSDRVPYHLEVGAIGEFSAHSIPEDPEERGRVLDVIRANGASMMYGSMRHVIQEMTRSTMYPQLILPSVQFQHVVENEKRLEEEDSDDVLDELT
jgi:preprotein translocase subunit SecB